MNPVTRQELGYEEGGNVTVIRDNFVAGPIAYQRGVKTVDYQIGTQVVREAESWARELGFTRVAVESRDNKIPFYESMGYVPHLDRRIEGETFTCYRMDKNL